MPHDNDPVDVAQTQPTKPRICYIIQTTHNAPLMRITNRSAVVAECHNKPDQYHVRMLDVYGWGHEDTGWFSTVPPLTRPIDMVERISGPILNADIRHAR